MSIVLVLVALFANWLAKPLGIMAPAGDAAGGSGVTSSRPERDRTVVQPDTDVQRQPITVQAPSEALHLSVSKGRLTLYARNADLHAVVAEFSAKTGVTVTEAADIRHAKVNFNLDQVSFDEAARLLLEEFDGFLYQHAGRLSAVWVYGPGQGRYISPRPDAEALLMQRTREADAWKRADAYEKLLDKPGGKAQELLEAGLRDPEAGVRLRVLNTALVTNIPLPADILANLAASDASLGVRRAALAALNAHAEADPAMVGALAEKLRDDADPFMKSQAEEILSTLNSRDAELADREALAQEIRIHGEDSDRAALPVDGAPAE